MAGAAAERKAIRVLLVEDEEIHRVRTCAKCSMVTSE
jgi:hypothetical protein